MKVLGLIVVVSLFAACAVADVIDPKVIITNGTGTTFLGQPIFNFSLDDTNVCSHDDTGWSCAFMNISGTPWASLTLFIQPPQEGLSCDPQNYFGACSIDPSGSAEITFTNGEIPSGVCGAFGELGQVLGTPEVLRCSGPEFVLHFSPEFKPDSGVGGLATVPEPASMMLMGTGLAGLASRRRKS